MKSVSGVYNILVLVMHDWIISIKWLYWQFILDQQMKEGNVLFNDALNTFYLWLYGIRHMVKHDSESERGNPLLPHGYSFQLAARVLLYTSFHRQDNTYHGLCYTSHGALVGMRNRSMVHHEGSIRWPITPWVNALTTELHLAPYRQVANKRKCCSLLLCKTFCKLWIMGSYVFAFKVWCFCLN